MVRKRIHFETQRERAAATAKAAVSTHIPNTTHVAEETRSAGLLGAARHVVCFGVLGLFWGRGRETAVVSFAETPVVDVERATSNGDTQTSRESAIDREAQQPAIGSFWERTKLLRRRADEVGGVELRHLRVAVPRKLHDAQPQRPEAPGPVGLALLNERAGVCFGMRRGLMWMCGSGGRVKGCVCRSASFPAAHSRKHTHAQSLCARAPLPLFPSATQGGELRTAAFSPYRAQVDRLAAAAGRAEAPVGGDRLGPEPHQRQLHDACVLCPMRFVGLRFW